ncbi:hypothetical protein QVD17_37664 [Tagetes erecta]|uniref:Uncharacterized protein n=1 Tax=Tagetes erecta TaxID=13708 RepID=A0AAD8NCW4_TARER|nr:hypothetical protein QVD17_37664 [Tagetes erecta]
MLKPIQVLSRCFIKLENTMTPCSTQYHTPSPTIADNSVYIPEMTPLDEYEQDQSQHFQMDMDLAEPYVDLFEQQEQVFIPQAPVHQAPVPQAPVSQAPVPQAPVPQAHVSMPLLSKTKSKLKPKPKPKPKAKLSLKEKQEKNISCALEKIAKERSEDIQIMAGQLRSFYGNEYSIQVFSPFAMYPEVVPEYIEFEAVLQCFSNGLLDISFIHWFEMYLFDLSSIKNSFKCAFFNPCKQQSGSWECGFMVMKHMLQFVMQQQNTLLTDIWKDTSLVTQPEIDSLIGNIMKQFFIKVLKLVMKLMLYMFYVLVMKLLLYMVYVLVFSISAVWSGLKTPLIMEAMSAMSTIFSAVRIKSEAVNQTASNLTLLFDALAFRAGMKPL